MIQITPQMRIWLAVEPVDFRKGIDGLAQVCRQRLKIDPLAGALVVFSSRRPKALKCLVFDGYGNTEIMGRPLRPKIPFRKKTVFPVRDNRSKIIAPPERPGCSTLLFSGRAANWELSGGRAFLSSCSNPPRYNRESC